MDIYIEVRDETLGNYVETNFLSRWCGWKKPSVIVSYNNIIIFAYHTDGTQRGSFFKGFYEFIDAGIIEMNNTTNKIYKFNLPKFFQEPYNKGQVHPDKCEYEFNSESFESGQLISPTYPGTYPNILNCTYKFIGKPGERLSIQFDEVLLHYGADQ